MKKITIILFLTLFSVVNVHAAMIGCKTESYIGENTGQYSHQSGIKERLKGTCTAAGIKLKNKNGWETKKIKFTLEGYGLGLRITAQEGFALTCPNALFKNLGEREFYGIRASAAALLGANVGVFANSRGGICIMTGIFSLGVGAGISGAKLEFYE